MFKKKYEPELLMDNLWSIKWRYASFPLCLLGWFGCDEYDGEIFFSLEETKRAIKQLETEERA